MFNDEEIEDVNCDDSEPEPFAENPYPSREPVLPPEAAMDEPPTASALHAQHAKAPWEKDDA